jgi:hypothetical protein
MEKLLFKWIFFIRLVLKWPKSILAEGKIIIQPHWKLAESCLMCPMGLDLLPILPCALPSGSAVAIVGQRARTQQHC